MKYRLNDTSDVFILPVLKDNYIYVLRDEAAGKTAVIDPAEAAPVEAFLEDQGWQLDVILNTHHHWDHVNGNLALQKKYDCEVVGFAEDEDRIPGITQMVADGDHYTLGSLACEVIHGPGHTTGAITYYLPREKVAFVGDTIFAMGCGRLFEGSPEEMLASLDRLCEQLAPDTRLFNAHEYALANAPFAQMVDPGNDVLQMRIAICQKQRMKEQPCQGATLKMEQETNPFLRADHAEIAAALGLAEADRLTIFTELRARKDHFVA